MLFRSRWPSRRPWPYRRQSRRRQSRRRRWPCRHPWSCHRPSRYRRRCRHRHRRCHRRRRRSSRWKEGELQWARKLPGAVSDSGLGSTSWESSSFRTRGCGESQRLSRRAPAWTLLYWQTNYSPAGARVNGQLMTQSAMVWLDGRAETPHRVGRVGARATAFDFVRSMHKVLRLLARPRIPP